MSGPRRTGRAHNEARHTEERDHVQRGGEDRPREISPELRPQNHRRGIEHGQSDYRPDQGGVLETVRDNRKNRVHGEIPRLEFKKVGTKESSLSNTRKGEATGLEMGISEYHNRGEGLLKRAWSKILSLIGLRSRASSSRDADPVERRSEGEERAEGDWDEFDEPTNPEAMAPTDSAFRQSAALAIPESVGGAERSAETGPAARPSAILQFFSRIEANLPPVVRGFVDRLTASWYLAEHDIVVPEADKGPTVQLLVDMGIPKVELLLERTAGDEMARESLSQLVQKATNVDRPDPAIREFLLNSPPDQILLLVGSIPRVNIVNYLSQGGHLDILSGDPAAQVARIEAIGANLLAGTSDAQVRAVLLAVTARREFELWKDDPGRNSPEGLELLARFGIDPRHHERFPWNGADSIGRANLYLRVKAERKMFEKVFADAAPGREGQAKEIVDKIWDLIMVQDVRDTELPLTPHGWAHTLDVVRLQRGIYDNAPGLKRALIEKYGSEAKALAVLDLVGLLHDVGYGQLADGESKKIHAVRSGETFRTELAERVKKTYDLTDAQVEEIFLAIERHGSDKKTDQNGRPLADYMDADLDRPLLFAVRLADNLDSSVSRLRSIQTHPLFIEALQKMADLDKDPTFRDAGREGQEERLESMRAAYGAMFDSRLSPHDALLANGLLKKMNNGSWPHFKGCETVAEVSVREVDGALVVNFDIAGIIDFGTVNEKTEQGKVEVKVALYQLWRTYESAKSLKYQGGQIVFNYTPMEVRDHWRRDADDLLEQAMGFAEAVARW